MKNINDIMSACIYNVDLFIFLIAQFFVDSYIYIFNDLLLFPDRKVNSQRYAPTKLLKDDNPRNLTAMISMIV